MKIPLKLILAAAGLALAPAAPLAQGAPASAPPAASAQAPRDSVSADSQAAPARPETMSPPATAGEEPSNAAVLSSSAARTAPDATVGQPTGYAGFQPQVTPIGEEALWFHNWLLMPVITVITAFVLLLLLIVIVRFRRGANPVPSRTTHNTVLEVVWTLIPVLILVAIAVPSIRLLAHQYNPPKADITVKATGNQWYWTYTYPDHGGFEIVSNGLSKQDAEKRGEPRLFAVDERMVVPVGATVKMIVTSSDVIHSWGVPAFWVKMDAVPGRLNETWFKTDRPGLYYGQCYELCGARHAFMPIAVEVVPAAQFAAWIASKGGTMPGAGKPLPDSTAASPVTNPAPAPASAGNEATPQPTLTPGTATPAATNQAAETAGN